MSKGMAKASPRLPLRFLTIATSSGLLLWFVLAQGNDLWLPPPLQPLGHGIYRIVYWFTLPTQWLSLLLTPVAHHHVPASNAPMAAALTLA